MWYVKTEDLNPELLKRLLLGFYVSLMVSIVVLILSIYSKSLVLLGDFFQYMLSLASFLVSLGAVKYSKIKPSNKFTFGFHRLEVIGAILVNTIQAVFQSKAREACETFVGDAIRILAITLVCDWLAELSGLIKVIVISAKIGRAHV